jgi:diguanylate cyclase (GGDEF)-like protein
MSAALNIWIASSLDRGRFTGSASVVAFAASRAIATMVAALALNFAVYAAFDYFNLFGITRPPSVIGDAVVTACVSGPIAFLAFFIVGRAIQGLAISRDEFQRLSRTDSLTGLLNRRAFLESIRAVEAPYALAVLDIDRFKSVNDTYGHGAGDEVLGTVSRLMLSHFGIANVVARLGGEEFGLLLGGVGKTEAMAEIERFRALLSAMHIDVGSAVIEVSVSGGVSQGESNPDVSALLTHADRALYLAKASGRNRIVHADELGPLGAVPAVTRPDRRVYRGIR